MQINLFIILLILSFLVSLGLTIYIGIRRTNRLRSELFMVMLSISIWCFAAVFEAATTDLGLKILFSKISYLGIVVLPVFFFFFVSRYTNMDYWLTNKKKFFFFIFPVATLIIVFTNEFHGLVWPDIYLKQNSIAGILAFYEHGPWYWIHLSYSYFFLGAGIIMLVFSLFRYNRYYSNQGRSLVIASIIPFIGNIIYTFMQAGVEGIEMTPIYFTLTGALLTIAIFKYQLIDITPVARETITENLYDGILIINKDNRIIDINEAACKLLSISSRDIGKPVEQVLSRHVEILEFLNLKKDSEKTVGDVEIKDKKLYFELRTAPLLDNAGGLMGTVIILRDITLKKISDRELKESRNLLKNIIDFLPDATFAVNKKGKIIAWNKAMENFSGLKKEEMLGKGNYEYSLPFYGERRPALVDYLINDPEKLEKQYNLVERKGDNLIAEVKLKSDGKEEHIWLAASPLLNSKNEIIGAIESLRNITDIKNIEKQLRHISFHDSLTGLYNRSYFEEEYKRLQKSRQLPISIIMADINGLKLVNDAFGHNMGDRLLKKAAMIISQSCRADDVVARWGGDEFSVILPLTGAGQAREIIERIQKRCSRSTCKIPISISMGSSTKINPETRISTILKKAEDSMYSNKLLTSKSVQNTIIGALTGQLYKKNIETESHSERVVGLSKKLAQKMNLPDSKFDELVMYAKLHDIGKVAVSEKLLKKKSSLNEDEWEEIKKHSEIGYRIANSSSILAPIAEYILCQHEWWDGSGYPRGLEGERIPLISRIVSVVDAFDAMTSDRPYRKAYSKEEAIMQLKRTSGIQFDPAVIEKFLELLNEKG